MKIGMRIDATDQTVPIGDVARAAEDAGVESLRVTRRTHLCESEVELLSEPGHEMDAQVLDPFVALTAAATATTRLLIGTGACYAALYDPLILAKQVASLDVVSSGRFLFGVTPGWQVEVFRNHGIDPQVRWRLLREKVLAMKALWTSDVAEFDGEFVSFAPVHVGLRPVQRSHPPILVGSNGPRGLARALDYGDEWFPIVSTGALAAMPSPLPIPTTGFLWEIDGELLQACAERGFNRCIVYSIRTASNRSRIGLLRYVRLFGARIRILA